MLAPALWHVCCPAEVGRPVSVGLLLRPWGKEASPLALLALGAQYWGQPRASALSRGLTLLLSRFFLSVCVLRQGFALQSRLASSSAVPLPQPPECRDSRRAPPHQAWADSCDATVIWRQSLVEWLGLDLASHGAGLVDITAWPVRRPFLMAEPCSTGFLLVNLYVSVLDPHYLRLVSRQ